MTREFAPAKVNLALHVTGRRADGYHLLDSLVIFADIGDRLSFEDATDRSLTVTGPFADGVPTGPDNLIWQAVDLVDADRPFALTLEKNLPHAAGIGGGSSDAAAALRAMARLTGANASAEAILTLGADLPVCVHGAPSRMRGIGDRLDPVPPLPPVWLVLANPRVPTPTGPVFQGLATRDNPPMDAPRWSPDNAESFFDWLSVQRNDLEIPASGLVPEVTQTLQALRATKGCRLARMSGSGATCFGLYGSEADAITAAASLSRDHPAWWVTATAPHKTTS